MHVPLKEESPVLYIYMYIYILSGRRKYNICRLYVYVCISTCIRVCVCLFCFCYIHSRSGPLKAANLQQCMGTVEGSPMWLREEWASSREWSEQYGQRGAGAERTSGGVNSIGDHPWSLKRVG